MKKRPSLGDVEIKLNKSKDSMNSFVDKKPPKETPVKSKKPSSTPKSQKKSSKLGRPKKGDLPKDVSMYIKFPKDVHKAVKLKSGETDINMDEVVVRAVAKELGIELDPE
jgi:hypothetical protein